MKQNIYFIGQFGNDAGGWYIGADGKIHRVPGWNPDAMAELGAAVNIIRYTNLIKNATFGPQVMKEAVGFAQKQFATYVKEGGIVVIGGH